jgi:hypothetical protein
MGYYIHTCAKMRYKAAYRPSELLCPVTFKWADLAACVPLIEEFDGTALCDADGTVLQTVSRVRDPVQLRPDSTVRLWFRGKVLQVQVPLCFANACQVSRLMPEIQAEIAGLVDAAGTLEVLDWLVLTF